jgi:hypothetical protein
MYTPLAALTDSTVDASAPFGAQPFVIFSETQLAHGNSSGPDSSGGRDWNNGELLSNIAANVINPLLINGLLKTVITIAPLCVAISLHSGRRKKAYVDQSLAWRANNKVVAISFHCSAFSTHGRRFSRFIYRMGGRPAFYRARTSSSGCAP